MSSCLYSVLVALHALAATATPPLERCSSGGVQNVTVDGWPVVVALRIPGMAKATMNLSLSHDYEVHTHLTLSQTLLDDRVGVLQLTLQSRMMRTAMTTATLLPDSRWSTLSIVARDKEMELRIESETRSVKYSTSAFLSTTHYLLVNTVSCSGRMCGTCIDLQCGYDKSKDDKEHKARPVKNTSESGLYYWALYVVVTLLVMACLLFLIWRNEHKKFRTRWSKHSSAVRRIASTSAQEEDSRHVNGRIEMMEWRAETGGGHINSGYDNTGDND